MNNYEESPLLLTGISKFAPASMSIWTMASSPAAQAYISGVIPCREKEKRNYLPVPGNLESVMDTVSLNLSVQTSVCVQGQRKCAFDTGGLRCGGGTMHWHWNLTGTEHWGQDREKTERITENASHVLTTTLQRSQGCQERNAISWIVCSQMKRKQKTPQKYTRLIYPATYPHC